MTPIDISVVGPMARYAEDLDLALRALAGPDLLQQAAWRVELPPPRRCRLGEFRVAVRASSPLCRIDASVSDLFDRAIDAIARAGATVDATARPGFDERNTSVSSYCCCARRRPHACVTKISPGNGRSPRRSTTTIERSRCSGAGRDIAAPGLGYCQRGTHEVALCLARILQALRCLLTPVAATAAFPHDRNPNGDERTVSVNGKLVPYAQQIFFEGSPASRTCRPPLRQSTSLQRDCRLALQIIGSAGEDPTTIEFARLLAAEIGSFVPPPAYT